MKTLFSSEFKFAEENKNSKLKRKRTSFSQIIILLQGSYTGLKETDNPSSMYQIFHCSKRSLEMCILCLLHLEL